MYIIVCCLGLLATNMGWVWCYECCMGCVKLLTNEVGNEKSVVSLIELSKESRVTVDKNNYHCGFMELQMYLIEN